MFAEGSNLFEYLVADLFSLRCRRIEAEELTGLGFGEQLGLGEEPEEIVIGLEQLIGRGGCIVWIFRVNESIVQGIDEIEGGIAAKFEGLRHWRSHLLF